MIHALIWLPLLALFCTLAWAGWNEYTKVQAYGQWARTFDTAKYDVLAVLGFRDDRLVWGRPTRRGPVDLQEIPLENVKSVQLFTDNRLADPDTPPARARRVALRLHLADDGQVSIPFTEAPLAAAWCKLLQKNLIC
jgi:hypothetical protein